MAALRKRIADLAAASTSNDEQPAAKQRRMEDERDLQNVLQQFKCVVCLEFESLMGYGAECKNGHRVCIACFQKLQRTTVEMVSVLVDEGTPGENVIEVPETHHGSRRCIICTPYGGEDDNAGAGGITGVDFVAFEAGEPSQFYKRLERTLTFECEHVGCRFRGAMEALKTHDAVCLHRMTKCCVRYCPFQAPLQLHELTEHILGAAHRQANYRAPPGCAVTMCLALQKYDGAHVQSIEDDMTWAFVMSHAKLGQNGFLTAADGAMKHYVVQVALQDDTLTVYVSALQPYERMASMHSARIKIHRGEQKSGGVSRKIRIRDCSAADSDNLKAMFTAGEALTLPASADADCIDAFASEATTSPRTRTGTPERYTCLSIAVKLLPKKEDGLEAYHSHKWKKMVPAKNTPLVKPFSVNRKAARHLDSTRS